MYTETRKQIDKHGILAMSIHGPRHVHVFTVCQKQFGHVLLHVVLYLIALHK